MIKISIKDQIKNYFFFNPTQKKRVRELERELKLPLPSVIRYVKELEQEQILQKMMISNICLFTANRNSPTFLLQKKLWNIYQLHSSGLIEFLNQEYSNPVIILFGSYAKGEDTQESDIDLYIETASKKVLNVQIYEKKLQRTIQIFKHKNIHEVQNKHLANNIINGITLNGFVEVL